MFEKLKQQGASADAIQAQLRQNLEAQQTALSAQAEQLRKDTAAAKTREQAEQGALKKIHEGVAASLTKMDEESAAAIEEATLEASKFTEENRRVTLWTVVGSNLVLAMVIGGIAFALKPKAADEGGAYPIDEEGGHCEMNKQAVFGFDDTESLLGRSTNYRAQGF